VAASDQSTDDKQRARIAAMPVAERLALLDRLCRDLTRIAAHALSEGRGANATLLLDLGQLDTVQRLPGLAPWDQLRAAAEEYEVEGLRLRTVDRETLIQRKRARGTPQDHADVEAIQRLDG